MPLLQSTWHSGESGGNSVWHAPQAVSSDHVEAARAYVNAMLAERPPAPIPFIQEQCAALLTHFFNAATGEKLNAIAAAHWINILSPFPKAVLHAAIKKWLETSSYKPKPHEIRELCIQFYGLRAWNEFERASIIAQMQPTLASTPQVSTEEEFKKPDDEKKAKVAEILHKNRLAHSPEFCAACKAEAKTE